MVCSPTQDKGYWTGTASKDHFPPTGLNLNPEHGHAFQQPDPRSGCTVCVTPHSLTEAGGSVTHFLPQMDLPQFFFLTNSLYQNKCLSLVILKKTINIGNVLNLLCSNSWCQVTTTGGEIHSLGNHFYFVYQIPLQTEDGSQVTRAVSASCIVGPNAK